jgi:hypothetical protein
MFAKVACAHYTVVFAGAGLRASSNTYLAVRYPSLRKAVRTALATR